jgi:hypothetical protein
MGVIVALQKRAGHSGPITEAEHDNNLGLIEEGFSNCAAEDHTHDYTTLDGLPAALDSKIPSTEKGAADGVAPLDGTGKIPAEHMQGVLSTEDINNLDAALAERPTSTEVDTALETKADATRFGNVAGMRWIETTLVGGSKVVTDAEFLATDDVYPTIKTPGGTPGWIHCSLKEAGGFTLVSSSPADTSVVRCLIITPEA